MEGEEEKYEEKEEGETRKIMKRRKRELEEEKWGD